MWFFFFFFDFEKWRPETKRDRAKTAGGGKRIFHPSAPILRLRHTYYPKIPLCVYIHLLYYTPRVPYFILLLYPILSYCAPTIYPILPILPRYLIASNQAPKPMFIWKLVNIINNVMIF